MTEPISNANSTPPSAPAAKTPAVVRAVPLKEFLLSDKPSPGGYLNTCRKVAPPQLGQTEVDGLTKVLASQPKALSRLIALLIELDDPGTVVAGQVTDLTEAFVRSALPAEVSLPPLKPGLAAGTVKTAVRAFMSSAPSLELRRKREPLVMLAWWVARLRGVVEHDELVEIVAREFPPSSKGGKRASTHGTESIWVQITRELSPVLRSPAPRSALLRLMAAFQPALKEADAARDAEFTRVVELRQQVSELEGTIVALRTELAARDASLHERDATITKITGDLAAEQSFARQNRRALKSRMIGFLNGLLNRSLRDAFDATTVTPVREQVILDRLQTAFDTLKKETQWLESSD